MLPLTFYLITMDKTTKVWKTTVLPLTFYLMTTDKKRQCYPLRFISWKKRHCYPLDFIWWRRRQNDSVTPYVLFDDDGYKITVLPLMFYFKKKITVTLTFYLMTANKKQQHCYPLRFIRWRPIKNRQRSDLWEWTLSQRFIPLCFISWWLMKYRVTLYVLFHEKNDIVIPSILFDDNE